MEIKDFGLPDMTEGIPFVRYENMDMSSVPVKEEMYSEMTCELNACKPEDSMGIMSENVPSLGREEVKGNFNSSVTPFCCVGIKMEKLEDYESDTSCVSLVTKRWIEYPRNPERAYNLGVQSSSDKMCLKLSNSSSTEKKMENEEDIENHASGLRTNECTTLTVDKNSKLDSSSVVHGYSMGHSSSEFIRGIECHEYPLLCVKQEEDKTDEGFGVNRCKQYSADFTQGASPLEEQVRLRSCTQNDLESLSFMEGDTVSSSMTKHSDLHLSSRSGKEVTFCRSFPSTNEHKTANHTAERRFSCNICESAFNRRNTLNKHLRTHTGEKPYQCKICEKSFNQGGHLKTHILSHTKEKPFHCTLCDAAFIWMSKLKLHMRTHTGEKPYKCSICEKSFTLSGNLDRHMRIHTKEKP